MRMFNRSMIQQLSCMLAGSLICASTALAQQALAAATHSLPGRRTQCRRRRWTAPNKPHWKLSEVLAKHSGQRS